MRRFLRTYALLASALFWSCSSSDATSPPTNPASAAPDGGLEQGDGGPNASDAATTCTADLANDPKNCGRCAHDCLGGTCIATRSRLPSTTTRSSSSAPGKVPQLVFEHEEKRLLKPIPTTPFDTDDVEGLGVTKMFLVPFDRNRYYVAADDMRRVDRRHAMIEPARFSRYAESMGVADASKIAERLTARFLAALPHLRGSRLLGLVRLVEQCVEQIPRRDQV